MTDKEHEIPVKVVDRRWWAPGRRRRARRASRRSLEADLCRGARAAGRREGPQLQEYIAQVPAGARASSKRRGCGCGARSRRTSSAAAARSSRTCSRSSTTSIARSSRPRQAASPEALLQGVELVRRQFLAKLEGLGVTRIEAAEPAVRSRSCTKRSAPSRPPRRSGRQRRRRRAARLPRSATTCCGRRPSRSRRLDDQAR